MKLFSSTVLLLCSSSCGLLLGTALSTAAVPSSHRQPSTFRYDHHAIVRAPADRKEWALIFTGGEYNDGGAFILEVLRQQHVHAGFFFTGDFYRHPDNRSLIARLFADGHYLGPHSDAHLLYCDWNKRDSSLVSQEQFQLDLQRNYQAMATLAVSFPERFFIPPFEWYNEQHVRWAADMGITLFNFTPGPGTQADYTTPDMPSYKNSATLYKRFFDFIRTDPAGLCGAIVLLHIGTHPARADKFYHRLPDVLDRLRLMGYRPVRIDSLLTRP